MLPKDIFVPLTICIDQTRRALVIVLPCYGALEIVGVIIIITILSSVKVLLSLPGQSCKDACWANSTSTLLLLAVTTTTITTTTTSCYYYNNNNYYF